MTIESRGMSKEYAGEFTSIYMNGRRLIKDPSCLITFNPIPFTMIIMVASILVIIGGILFLLRNGGIILGILIGMLFIEVIVEIKIMIGWKKCYKELYRPDYERSATIDESGITFNDKSRSLSYSWDTVKALRIEKNGIYFIPKGPSGMFLGFSIEHKDRILEYVKSLNVDLELVE